MPPRGTARGRGAAPTRSDPPGGGNGGLPQHGLSCVGVARPGFGSSGNTQTIFVNSFVTTMFVVFFFSFSSSLFIVFNSPEGIIHHYDGKWLSSFFVALMLIFFPVGSYSFTFFSTDH